MIQFEATVGAALGPYLDGQLSSSVLGGVNVQTVNDNVALGFEVEHAPGGDLIGGVDCGVGLEGEGLGGGGGEEVEEGEREEVDGRHGVRLCEWANDEVEWFANNEPKMMK